MLVDNIVYSPAADDKVCFGQSVYASLSDMTGDNFS